MTLHVEKSTEYNKWMLIGTSFLNRDKLNCGEFPSNALVRLSVIEDISSLYFKCLAEHNFHNNKCLFKGPCPNLSEITVYEIYWYN